MEEKNKDYTLTVGLEIHAELATKSKMWCGCKNDPDEVKPNVNICPICMGHPGSLPTINKEAVRQVLRIGKALGGAQADFTEFDRKNYFYPDIPKGYQISQYKYPLVTGGILNGVSLTRVHLEEDTGVSIHDRGRGDDQYSLINFNRAGVPLMELVTEPVIRTAEEASNFAKEFQLLLQYLGAGNANLEKGEMRVEANISVSKNDSKNNWVKSKKLGTKVEVKNLNSFKAVEKAINFEMERHIEKLERGEKVVQETRGWDEKKEITFSQRSKEDAHDYRYFPDPDLPKLKLSLVPEFSEKSLVESLPELPSEKRKRYSALKMQSQHIDFFVSDLQAGDYFDKVLEFLELPEEITLATNYIAVDLWGLREKENFAGFPEPKNIAELVKLISKNILSSRGAKDVLTNMVSKNGQGKSPKEIAEKLGVIQESDVTVLKSVIQKIIEENPRVVEEFKTGKEASLQFLIGQAMKETRGSANPNILKEILIRALQ